ncbi:hypothetical protein [Thermosediminibacter litoriperuensis]|uniref:hypothetical protein n=1 Tax=Thermosediminibacter litoriperuensis TaxID=291989 RepID=UPI0011E6B86E|nr:hypothetical protein [Thermosediminibacter litoriperuensis]
MLVLIIEAVTLIQAKAPSGEEKEEIIQLLKKAKELPDKVYIQAKQHYKNRASAENKAAIIENGKKLYKKFSLMI